MKILERIKVLPKKKEDVKFQAIILKIVSAKNSYEGKILGRTLEDWVAFACNGINVKVVDYDGTSNLLGFVRDKIDHRFDYSIILMSKTPLLTGVTIKNIIEYCSVKEVDLCKLPIGYVVKNDYFFKMSELVIDSLYSQNLDDFFVVENKKQFVQAEGILQDRINSFHMSNGVDIRKPQSVYIEPEVDIGSGVVIFPGNSIKGQTTIMKDVILKENNVIENSIVGSESCISGSVISGTMIEKNVYISAFCDINNSQIGENSIIDTGCKIEKYNVLANSKIKAKTILGEIDDSDCGSGKSR